MEWYNLTLVVRDKTCIVLIFEFVCLQQFITSISQPESVQVLILVLTLPEKFHYVFFHQEKPSFNERDKITVNF
jgi:hypothetical protein